MDRVEDAFWSSFQSVAPMEATAFESNPCALASGRTGIATYMKMTPGITTTIMLWQERWVFGFRSPKSQTQEHRILVVLIRLMFDVP